VLSQFLRFKRTMERIDKQSREFASDELSFKQTLTAAIWNFTSKIMVTSNRDKVPHRSFLAEVEFTREFSVVLPVYFAEYTRRITLSHSVDADDAGLIRTERRKWWTKNCFGWHKIEFILTHIRIWHQRSIDPR